MIYYNSKYIYSIIIILVISVYFLIEIGKISNGYVFEHLDTSITSRINKLFPKINTLKVFQYKTIEPIKKNKVIEDVQEFDYQIFEYKNGGN